MFENLRPPFPAFPDPGLFPVPGLMAGSMPAGAIIAFAGDLGPPVSSPPDLAPQPPVLDQAHVTHEIEAWGWMACDGRPLNVSAYPELFLALGYRYGGSGERFNIPDLRGQFLRGVAIDAAQDPGFQNRKLPNGEEANYVGSAQEDALQKHEHIYQTATATTPGDGPSAAAEPAEPRLTSEPTDSLSPPGNVKADPFETRPKNIYVHYLIKFL